MATKGNDHPQENPRGELARSLSVLADPIRLRMLNLMLSGALSPAQFAELLGIEEKTASKHLFLFREHKLVAVRKTRNNVKYYGLRHEKECPHFRLISLVMELLEGDPVMCADVAIYQSLHAQGLPSRSGGECSGSNQVSTVCLDL